ncbi:MAG: glycosyltransferase [Geminicoccaceae bacterium]
MVQPRPAPAGAAPPTVLHVLPSLDGDERATATVGLCRALRGEGWRVVVASAGGRLEVRLRAGAVEHRRLPLDSANPLTVAGNVRRLAALAADCAARLVHVHAGPSAWSAVAAARKAGLPVLATCHDLPASARGPLGRAWAQAPLRADRLIAVSADLAERLGQVHAVPAARLRTVHPGVDLAEFDPAAIRGNRIGRLAESWRLAPDRPVVLLPGPVHPDRGHALLLQAAATLERRDFAIVFAGPTSGDAAADRTLEAAVRQSGLAERVRFVGACPDMPAAYMLADVVALPAVRPPGFALAAIEAQAMGRPVVVTAAGGLPEAVQPASTGWLVRPDDPAELAWALDRALALEPDVRERLADRCRGFVASELGVQQAARRTAAVYAELVPSPQPA